MEFVHRLAYRKKHCFYTKLPVVFVFITRKLAHMTNTNIYYVLAKEKHGYMFRLLGGHLQAIKILILSFSFLSDDRSKASSKTIPPHSAI
jgi:hypothetical protein